MKNEVQYAGLWERFLALLVDTLLFCACFFPITRLVKGVWLMSPNNHHWVRGWFISDPLCLIFLVIMASTLCSWKAWPAQRWASGFWACGWCAWMAADPTCGKARCGTPCAWWTACPHSISWGRSSSQVRQSGRVSVTAWPGRE